MGFFQKIIDGLKKTKERIGFKLNEIFKRGIFDEDFYEELEFILLSADVGEETAEDIIDQLRERMRQDRVADAKRANQYLREVLCEILGDEKFEIQTPCVITVAGVNGVGKTTTIGKLANIFVKQGKSVVIAAADTFRAAAGEQLEVWAKRAGVRIIKHEEGSDPAAVVFDAEDGVELDALKIAKIKNFAELAIFCDLPFIVFSNVKGIMPTMDVNNSYVLKEIAEYLEIFQQLSTPKLSVVYKKAVGLGYSLFASKSIGFDYACAFANAKIALFDGAQGAKIELSDEKAEESALVARYSEENSDPINAAKDGYIDAIIEPQFVKQHLIASLQMLIR